jgi:hypothetical protein
MVERQISSTCCLKAILSYNARFYKESEEIDLIQKPAILPKKDLENSLFRET